MLIRKKEKKNSRQRVPMWRDGLKSNRETILLLSNNKKKINTKGCKTIKLPYHIHSESTIGIKNPKIQAGIPSKIKKRNFFLLLLKKAHPRPKPPKIARGTAPPSKIKGEIKGASELW